MMAKKLWERVQEDIEKNRQVSEQIRVDANNQFNSMWDKVQSVANNNLNRFNDTQKSIDVNTRNQMAQNMMDFTNRKRTAMQSVSNVIQENAKKREQAKQENQMLIDQANEQFRKQHSATVNTNQKQDYVPPKAEVRLASNEPTANLKRIDTAQFYKTKQDAESGNIFGYILDKASTGLQSVGDSILNIYTTEALNMNEKAKEINKKIGAEDSEEIKKMDRNLKELTNNTKYQAKKSAISFVEQDFSEGIRTLGNASESVGAMVPSLAVGAISPTAGLAVTGVTASGSSMKQALDEGATPEQAQKAGVLKGGVEVATEKLFGGIKFFGKGSLDDIFTDKVLDKVSSRIGKFAIRQGYDITGEVVEEHISNIAGYGIDKLVLDKDLPTLKQMIEDADETTKTTILSTLILKTLGIPINSSDLDVDNLTDKQKKDFQIVKKMLYDNDSLKQNINEYMAYNTNQPLDSVSQQWLNRANNIINENNPDLQQNTTNNPINPLMQQTTSQENKVAQNGNMKQINNTKTLYHQTKASSLEEMNTSMRKAGLSDTTMPSGIFLKESDIDIGLEGKNQLKLEATMKNTLEVNDRNELTRILSQDEQYKQLRNEANNFEKIYSQKAEEMSMQATTPKEIAKVENYINDSRNKLNEYAEKIQNEAKDYLQKQGYDSVVINEDNGSFGRKEKSYIVFDKSQLNELANNQQTVYNNTESEGVINGQSQFTIKEKTINFEKFNTDGRGRISEDRQGTIKGIYQQENGREQGKTRDRANTRREKSSMGSENQNDAQTYYREFEQQARKNQLTNISKESQQVKQVAKDRYRKILIHFDDNNTKFGGGLSKIDDASILFGQNTVEEYGDTFLLGHEIGEDMLKYHSDKVGEKYNEFKVKIQADANFPNVFLDYVMSIDKELRGLYTEQPELVAKELICDTLGFMQNDNELGNNLPHKDIQDVWINQLDNNLVKEIKETLKEYHDEIYPQVRTNTTNQLKEVEANTQSLGYKPDIEGKQKANIALSGTVEADLNLNKFKKDNDIKNDIITENKQQVPISESKQEEKVARILEKSPDKVKENDRKWAIFKANILDKGIVFEELSRKTKNRDLQGKWDYTLSASARGQNAIGNARYEFDSKTKTKKQISKSLEDIRLEVGNKTTEFSEYMYHQLNIDRMTLEERFGGDTGLNYERENTINNKPVFGDSVTADMSKNIAVGLEQKYPKFKEYAQDVYDFLDANQSELVRNGVISQENAEHMKDMYPHYVPIGRVNHTGNAITVPLDTGKTGINSPIKSAKGGSSDILPLFDTIAQRTLQTYRASARNNFGIELKNTLNSIANVEKVNVDSVVDTMGQTIEEQGLLQKGEKGNNPTFTVFENGERITYEITKDMYDALKPVSDSSILGKTFKPLNKISNFRRGVLTEYNPLFSITNALKDAQDVLINSQHAAKTYSKFPEAYVQIMQKGYWYQEYVQNGGEQNSYFNANDNIFESDVKQSKTKNVLKMPLDKISSVNNVIELAPRLSEYIASREAGRSIETSMLDASRVTTNFKAGGDITKFANRNGATFLNASLQGAMQAVRNVQEANMNGVKGWTVLACKTAIAGLPAIILNNFIWGDDDDYDELQDYVKDNYYCIAKYGDGKFVRIPKGRALATIQKIISSADKYITDGKEINADNLTKDFWECLIFAKDNLAPNDPIDNNVVSPVTQVMTNTSWYGEDIVPSRLQDKPEAEQYDETTDSFSIMLGQILNVSPYKINYLLDQYGGGISDVALPLMTKQAENNPIEDKFTTDATMKSKYPGEFFEMADELKINANSSNATDEDKVKYKYISGIQSNISDLYAQKREIQNSDISDKDKKTKLKEVQKQINSMAEEGVASLGKMKMLGNTITIEDKQYYKTTNIKTKEKEWEEVSKEEKEKNKDISLKTYADYKEKIVLKTIQERKSENMDKEGGQLKDKDKIQVLLDSNYSNKEKTAIYENYIRSKPKENEADIFKILKQSNINIDEYLKYEQQEFTSDKEDDGTVKGKSIKGSKSKKVYEYVNNMKITKEQRLLILGTQYKLNRSEQQELYDYINKIPGQTQKEKLNIFSKYSSNFIVNKDNTINLNYK